MSAALRNGSARRPDHGDVVAGVRTRSIDGIHASVAERLGSASRRYTKTRRAVIDVLAETCCPLTVGQIRSNMAAPQSTVYRTLAILEEIRLVHRLTSNTSDFARFELAEDLLGHHHHLECAGCGTMIDITLADQLETDLARAPVAHERATLRHRQLPTRHRRHLCDLPSDRPTSARQASTPRRRLLR
ncbi:MAG TPA: transcriptional repressor [Acidimicrobiia bacterium]